MPSPNILALIEGKMERLFVNTNFPYVEVVSIDNGSGWTHDRLCDQISTKFYAKNTAPDLIVVWLDREKQDVDLGLFREGIIKALCERGANPDTIAVYIPDRMTENVILSDEVVIRAEFDNPDFVYAHAGKNGKSALSEMYKQTGVNYKETQHGVRLLKKVRLTRASNHCERLKLFIEELSTPCWWLDVAV
jgi:hypothetical protein